MTDAFIGLGSNIGERVENLRRALDGIASFDDTRVVAVSNVVESMPWGVTDQPLFANAVARVTTAIPADRFLALLKDLEAALGRTPGERNGPRVIDLDILLFGDDEWQTPDLTVPHPRLAERDFVVTPILDIAPHAEWPDGSAITRERVRHGQVTGVLGPVPGFEDLTPPPSVGTGPQADFEANGGWEEVASLRYRAHGAMASVAELMLDAAVLEQEGIPVGWDPAPPQEEHNPYPLPRTHRLLVPSRFAARARTALAEFHAATPVEESDAPD